MTRWRRVRARQEAGVWRKMLRVLLANYGEADKLDFSMSLPTVRRCALCTEKKVDRTEPIAVRTAANSTSPSMRKASRSMSFCMANRHDITQLFSLVEGVHSIQGKRG